MTRRLLHRVIEGHWPAWGPVHVYDSRRVIRHCHLCSAVWIRKRQ